MEIALLWFIFAIVVGVAAGARGRSGFGWFVLAILISPLIAVILLALLPSLAPSANAPTPETHVKCPDCAELVLREARVCKHCGCKLTPQPVESSDRAPVPYDAHQAIDEYYRKRPGGPGSAPPA